ncbi:PHP domain-containing protein [Planktothrix sp. FACHB-1365]|uniref:PHP domain-containing protein n=1 Tax=Planktothrix sp. FACHB-1365 TaxID=2692855 RepID=UPI001688C123|nr:PHP domain-containing protein [Planktothrix sp. FACHB-1365]MBD2482902.1 PHP domain-containing protein [Planktothrix sp. FACHB-1365]
MLELHCHTTYSDGQLTPTELVITAAEVGVKALAITDHDTLSGWEEAFQAAASYNIEIVPGVELSTVYNERSLHILGFYPDKNKLENPLKERLNGRKNRANQILEKLAQLGYPIELEAMGEGVAAARPHIARALVKAGYIQSPQEAFERWLGEHKPAFVQYDKFSSLDGIQLLKSCGAVPVWAHPYLYQGGKVETVFHELLEAGLMGIEVYHPHHSDSQIQRLEKLCEAYGLLKTGGSDYHGGGSALNLFNLSLNLLEPIKQTAYNLKEGVIKSQIPSPHLG